jgi:hypothetical protein
MRRVPSDLILVLCQACEARLPLRHDRAPDLIRCPLCGASNQVLKLLRRRPARRKRVTLQT